MESELANANQSEYFTFEQLEALAKRFRAALNSLEIAIQAESMLSTILDEVESLPAKREEIGKTREPGDVRPMWRDVLTVRRFALKFIRLYQRTGFRALIEHLTYLNEGKFGQNKEDRSEIGNKMFELWIALLAFETGTDLVIDPVKAKKSKPGEKKVDVLITYEGVRWAIECKVPGGSFESVLNRFDEAVEQVESSTATKGLVTISARNLIDHDAFWQQHGDGSYHSWNSDAEARQRLREEADDFSRKLKEARTSERWDEVLSGKKTIPVVGGVFQSACSIQLLGQPTVTDYCMMTLTNLGTGKAEIPDLLNAFNYSMYDRFAAS
jgi:hypothetical protein